MKILLFGGSGQLGLEIQKRAEDLNFEIVSPVISELDISDLDALLYLGRKVKPALIINSAAYTAVDAAETDKELAFNINATGAGNVARVAEDLGAKLIHISTDFVFDNRFSTPINEDAPTNPLSVYGASKLAGEREVLQYCPKRSLVVRTSSLHGAKGNNFVHTMLKLFAERESVQVVNDRFMSVTWAGWLSEVVLDLTRLDCNGIVHASCAGAVTWYEFAEEILNSVKAKLPGAERVKLLAISKQDFKQAAQRPDYSVLDCSRLIGLIGRKQITWRAGLHAHLAELGY